MTILPLELRNVSFEARGLRLIKDMSFHLDAQARTVVLGPNGAGKSLLMRICHGLIKPNAGEVIWHGSNGADPKLHQAAR